MAGDEYTIADMAIFPWYGMGLRAAYDARAFLGIDEYRNLARWTDQIAARKAVKRGRAVNRDQEPDRQLRERHAASDFSAITLD